MTIDNGNVAGLLSRRIFMSTNVYRAEERTYFGPDPCISQGYYMSTTSGGDAVYVDEDTWQVLESRAKGLFPECDCVRVAGLALIADSDSDLSSEAHDALCAEMDELNVDSNMDAHDAIDMLVNGKTLVEIVEGEGE